MDILSRKVLLNMRQDAYNELQEYADFLTLPACSLIRLALRCYLLNPGSSVGWEAIGIFGKGKLIALPPQLHEELVSFAKARGVTTSDILRIAIHQFMTNPPLPK